ncbi:UbiA prenyltransferase family protein [Parapedobacter indicus]|uniref:UbiA prenyltransferase family protein n=1 Tax=Parapedobacter indicus TaxID=1477437 RepID=A0A1I3QYP2_9SPHI|nr:UbiA prenyltransferase family protein [Parapedobacter indicus]SFJ38216.1 UbiA prenyltransferase family protein [Parapedobacter indicus]
MDLKGRIDHSLGAIRAHDWWDHKLPVLLFPAYATTFVYGIPLYAVAPYCLFLLMALAVGAAYVSLINDITDIDEDLAIGKPNRMAKIHRNVRWMFPIVCIALGVIAMVLLKMDTISIIFYSMSWLVFSLYSLRPFRWKTKGVLGVLCDASGAHMFPSLLMVTMVCHVANVQINYTWLISVAIWSFAFGLRGILWHQFMDKANDIQTNTRTFASKVDTAGFRPVATIIVITELVAFAVVLVYISQPILFFLLPVYFALVGIRFKKYEQYPIFILAPQNKPWQITMLDFYQFFLPVGLLVSAAYTQPWAWVVLVIHTLLFHKIAFIAIRDFSMTVRWGYFKLLVAIKRIA